MGFVRPEEPIWVKAGLDGTKLTHRDSVCVFSISAITSLSSVIGIIGATPGSDSYEDMILCGAPFFQQLKDLEANPTIATDAGNFVTNLKLGGDMSNQLDLFGLAKASSGHPCLLCVLDKKRFGDVFFDPLLYRACNSTLLRSRALIINDARGAKEYSTKHFPVSLNPIDPSKPLIRMVVIDFLHQSMRIVGGQKHD